MPSYRRLPIPRRAKRGQIIFITAGILLILSGIYLWTQAVIVQKINKKEMEERRMQVLAKKKE